jgi:hypothetical protein
MNERIKKLKDQCWVERRWNNDMWIEKHIDLEKFAELIVRECAELTTKEYNNRGAIHGNDLLEHFGVEE